MAALGRSGAELEALAAATGTHPYVLDVTDIDAVADVLARIESDLGVPGLLVNNAGVGGPMGRSWELTVADWWQVFEVNVLGVFACTRAVLPSMLARGSGRIVNVSSNAAFFPIGDDADGVINSAYMASKAAVVRFTEVVAGEAAARGVQVFAISPGTVKTDMTSITFADEWDDPDLWSPPELTADLVEYIDSGQLDALSGRYVHAARDDWRSMGARAEDFVADDLYALRLRRPDPAG